MANLLKKIAILVVIILILWYLWIFDSVKNWFAQKRWELLQKQVNLEQVEPLTKTDAKKAVNVILQSIKLSKGSYQYDLVLQKAIKLLAQNKAYVYTNILTLLKSADDPKMVLDHYISRLRDLVNQTQSMVDMLTFHSKEYWSKASTCRALKLEGDKQFFRGVELGMDWMAIEWLATSLQNADCYISNRIKSNAYKYVAYKLANYKNFFAQKLAFLEGNYQILVTNYPLLEDEYLAQLVKLKQQLEAFDLYSRQEYQTLWESY